MIDADLTAHRTWRESGGLRGTRFVLAGRSLDLAQATADLEDADLTGLSLPGAHLAGLRWSAAHLRGAQLPGAHLQGDLRGADLQGADLRDTVLEGVDLRGADLRGADLRGADLFACLLDDADLRDTRLDGVALTGAVFEAAMRDLQNRALATGGAQWFLEAVKQGMLEVAPLSSDGQGPAAAVLRALPPGATPADHPLPALVAYWLTPVPQPTWPELVAEHARWVASRGRSGQRLTVPNADLRGRDLQGAHLQAAGLVRARLQGALLQGACLDDALLLEADLTGANLHDTSLKRAHLRGGRLAGAQIAADMSGADLREVDLEHAAITALALTHTRLAGTELRAAHWTPIEAAWHAALATHPQAARDALRAVQGGIPQAGLAAHLAQVGLTQLPDSIAVLAAALRPGDMAMSQPVARLLSEWTLRFIGAGGTAGVRAATRPAIDPDTLPTRLADHARWRAGQGGERLSLAGAQGYGFDFTGADLRDADLAGVDLRGSVFDHADLRGADLRSADLREGRFDATRLAGAQLDGARFDGAWLGGLELAGAQLSGTSFARSLLSEANFRGVHFTDVSLAGTLLAGADLQDATFTRCDWRGAALAGAHLDGALLTGPWVFGHALVQGDLTHIEAAFRTLRDLPELAVALAASLREPPPRRRLLDIAQPLPEAIRDRVRAWLGALSGEDGAEVEMAVEHTLTWLGVPAPWPAGYDPHAGHDHHDHHHH